MRTLLRTSPLILVLPLLLCSPTEPPEQPSVLDEAWELLDIYFIFRDRLPAGPDGYVGPKELYDAANEPWTTYYSKEELAAFRSGLTTRQGGIGVLLDSVADGALIREVFAGSPGAEAGLLAGDTIVAVDDSLCQGRGFSTILGWLAGEIGQQRTLRIRRSEGEVEITVTLGEYLAPSVFTDSLDTVTAYIGLRAFLSTTIHSEGSVGEFREALARTSWAEYTILDLRSNGGGVIGQCLDIAGQFVPIGTPVVRSHERRGYYRNTTDGRVYFGQTHDTLWQTGVAGEARGRLFYVLVDGFTASAAEMLVSCLRDYRSADVVFVGDTTYGKGRGQVVIDNPMGSDRALADSGAAKITFSVVSPVNGPAYDSVGIAPDVQTVAGENALERARELIAQQRGVPLGKALAAQSRTGFIERARQSLHTVPEPLCIWEE